jgi:pimeloyl-ACP methyl ester carboxylesterase
VRSGFATSDGARLFYETTGDGPAVVLIHGGLWDGRMWDPQIQPLSRHHRLIRYDVRGYGRSDRIEKPYADHQDLDAVLDELEVERAALVGLSMGGRIAVEAALVLPQRVRALVLTPWALPGWDGWSEALIRRDAEVDAAVEAGDLERAVDLELAIWTPLQTGDDAGQRRIAHENQQELTAPDVRIGLDPSAHTRLPEVDAPTLIIVGEGDLPEMGTIADILAGGIPGARKVLLEGADHLPNVRRPDEFNRVVLGFLEEAAR